MIFSEITIALSTLLSGLIAGFFFAYTYSVNMGLGQLSDLAYLRAMQKINRAILNPIFYLTFVGPLVLHPLATIQQYHVHNFRFIGLLMASVIYLVGVILFTGTKNVPLNNTLDKIDLSTSTDAQISAIRQEFEKTWTDWHNIRTIAAVLTFGILIIVWLNIFQL